VRLGREVHDRVGAMRGEHLAHGIGVGHVGADERVPRIGASLLQRLERRGISHPVDIDHRVRRGTQQMSNHGGADEAAAAGQQNLHSCSVPFRQSGGNLAASAIGGNPARPAPGIFREQV